MTDTNPDALSHEPVNPSRNGIPGETAFLTAWQAWLEGQAEEDGPLSLVFEPDWVSPSHTTQEDATLAATFMQWLGTNAGACFIHRARGLARDARLSGPEAFLAAWAVENARKRPWNGGRRALESMMVPADTPRSLNGSPYVVPALSARQYELAEHLAAWLGTDAGQVFLAARERELETFRDHERVQAREAMRAGRAHVPGTSARGVAEYLAVLRRDRSRAA